MRCQNPICSNDARQRTGQRGPKPKYCSDACKTAASRHARNCGVVDKWRLAQSIEKHMAQNFGTDAYDVLQSLGDDLNLNLNLSRVNQDVEKIQAQRDRDKAVMDNFFAALDNK